MRIAKIFLASMLAATYGCGDDSSGDTGSNDETGHATDHNHDTGHATDHDTDHDTGHATDHETGEDTDHETGHETGHDGTSTGGDSTGGDSTGEPVTCAGFCEAYLATCGAEAANDYGDQAGCETACEGFSEGGFGCRQSHLALAMDRGVDPHCSHASNDGGGVCMD